MKLLRLKTHIVSLSVALLFPLSLTQAAIVFEDNFDAENGGVADNTTLVYTSFANWNVVSGDVDVIGNGFFDRYPGNGLYLDLDGVAADPGGRLESIQTFDPGTYELRLDLAGGGPGK